MKKSRERMKGFVIGFVAAMVLSSSIALVAGTGVMREVFFGVNLVVNGEQLELAEDMQPFIMGGRAFLPARIVEQITDMPVNWNDETWTVYIGRMPVEKEALLGRWQVVSIEQIFFGERELIELDGYAIMEFFDNGTVVVTQEGQPDHTDYWSLQAGQLVDREGAVMDIEIIDNTLILTYNDSFQGWEITIVSTLTRVE